MNKLFCLMGPTASGKTALACELVQRYPFEIISVDSAMIYKDMDIGTAKPSAQELALAPHHLINIKDPTESYSAAQFCTDALSVCETIRNKGKIPLLVGGTMMYFNALQKGMAILPEADELLREKIAKEALKYGWSALHHQLEQIDPETATRIHAHDAHRIQRALEVYYLTQTPLSVLLKQQTNTPHYQFINCILFPKRRGWLHEKINQRFDLMLEQGFIKEVEYLQSKWKICNQMTSMRCVGYRQVLDYLNGLYDQNNLKEKAKAATRQLAKRQLTWLRHWKEGLCYDPEQPTFQSEIVAKMGEMLDNLNL